MVASISYVAHAPLYSFWYSSLPSSFFTSASLRTALLKSSWLTASRSALMANKPLEGKASAFENTLSRHRQHLRLCHHVAQISAVQPIAHLDHALEIDLAILGHAGSVDLENLEPPDLVGQGDLDLAV